jgi:hypothetical protein
VERERRSNGNVEKRSVVNLQRVGTMVKDMREPCLSQSPIKVVITVRLTAQTFYFIRFRVIGEVFFFILIGILCC